MKRGARAKSHGRLPSAPQAPALARKIRLVPVNVRKLGELRWLHAFIAQNHSSPDWVLPALSDLRNPTYRDFKAFLGKELVGVSGYEIRTHDLGKSR